MLQANYGLDDDTPLALYDSLVPALQSRRHGNPYDCFEIDTIANWHEVKAENEKLKEVVKNLQDSHKIMSEFITDSDHDPKLLIAMVESTNKQNQML